MLKHLYSCFFLLLMVLGLGANSIYVAQTMSISVSEPDGYILQLDSNNPLTSMKFKIYNDEGKKVKEFIGEKAVEEIIWDGKDKSGNAVSSGIYLYRLETGKYSSTRKMLLMK